MSTPQPPQPSRATADASAQTTAHTTAQAQPMSAESADPSTHWSLPGLIAAHLGPGLATLIAYALSLVALSATGLPNMFALAIAVLIAEVPLCWWLMRRWVRREGHRRFTLAAVFPWQRRLRWWHYLAIGLPMVVFSIAVMGATVTQLEPRLLASLFAWVPESWVLSMQPEQLMQLSAASKIALLVLTLVSLTLVGGLTQELYFRGFLLPRMANLGWRAPLLNAGLFAIFHWIAPWGWLGFFLLSLPWAIAVFGLRSVRIGLFAHLGMLLIQWLMMVAMLTGAMPIPPG